jgi:hypothetical protein
MDNIILAIGSFFGFFFLGYCELVPNHSSYRQVTAAAAANGT